MRKKFLDPSLNRETFHRVIILRYLDDMIEYMYVCSYECMYRLD